MAAASLSASASSAASCMLTLVFVINFACTAYIGVLNIYYTVNREMFVFKNLRPINFRVKESLSASGSNEDF